MLPSYPSDFRIRTIPQRPYFSGLCPTFITLCIYWGHVTLLALFDVSSAFDSVQYFYTVFYSLHTSFGLVDQPLMA